MPGGKIFHMRLQVQQTPDRVTEKMLVLVDATARSGHPAATSLLARSILMAEEGTMNETFVKRVLHHLNTGLHPTEVCN